MVDGTYTSPYTGEQQPWQPDWLKALPRFQGPLGPPPNTTGNLFTSALSSGFHEALGAIGGAAQAGGTVFGMPGMAEWGRQTAEDQYAKAQQAGRQDLEGHFWSIPGALYGITKGIPATLGVLGAGMIGAATAPEAIGGAAVGSAIGAGLAAFPGAVGANVQAAQEAGQPIDAGNAAKAMLLGVPEAALNALAPEQMGMMLKGGLGKSIFSRLFPLGEKAVAEAPTTLGGKVWHGAKTIAPYNAAASAVQTGLTQQFWTPDMSIADRARAVVDSAMQGGISGAVMGGVVGAFARGKQTDTNEDLAAKVDAGLKQLPGPPGQLALPPPTTLALPPPTEPPVSSPARVAGLLTAGPHVGAYDQIIHGEPPPPPPPPPGEAMAMQVGGQPPPPGGVGGLPAVVEPARLTGPPEKVGPGLTPAEAAQVMYGQPPVTQVDAMAQFAEGYRQPQPPAEPLKALPAPPGPRETQFERPLGSVADMQLLELQDRLTSQGRLTGPEAAHLNQVNAELDRRTPPGMERGQGNLLTDADVRERSVPVAENRQSLLDGIENPKDRAAAEKSSFFQRFNAITEPDLVNSLKLAAQQYKTAKATPKWFADIAERYGVKTGKTDDVHTTLESLGSELESVEKTRDAAVASGKAEAIRNAEDHISQLHADIAKNERLAQLHDQAAQELARATAPREPLVPPVPEGGEGAVREPSAEVVDVRQETGDGAPVGQGDAEGNAPAAETAPGEDGRTGFEKDQEADPEGYAALLGDNTSETMGLQGAGRSIGGTIGATEEMRQALQRSQERAAAGPTDVAERVAAAREGVAQRKAAEQARAAEETARGRDASEARREASAREMSERIRARAAPGPNDEQRVSDAKQHGATEPSTPEKEAATRGWSKPSAMARNGDVIQEDDEHAVVRAWDLKTGKPIYSLVSRGLGQHTTGDFRTGGEEWVTKKLQKQYEAKVKAFEKEDAAAQKADPDGPFQYSKEKVVGALNVPKGLVSWFSRLMKSVGLGDVRVFIHHGNLVGDKEVYGLNGEYGRSLGEGHDPSKVESVAPFGPGNKDWSVYVRRGLDRFQTIQAVAHAMGHIIWRVAYNNAPKELQAAIDKAHGDFYTATTGLKGQDLLRIARNTEMQSGLDAMHPDEIEYLRSKPEWFADQVSRWASFSEQPKSALQRFFRAVAEKFQSLVQAMTGHKIMPDDAVRNFVENMKKNIADGTIDLKGFFEKGAETPETEFATASMKDSDERAKDGVRGVTEGWNVAAQAMRDGLISPMRSVFRGMLGWTPLSELVRDSKLTFARLYHQVQEMRLQWQNVGLKTHARLDHLIDKGIADAAVAKKASVKQFTELLNNYLEKLQNPWGLNGAKPLDFNKFGNHPDATRIAAAHANLQAMYSRIQQAGLGPTLDRAIMKYQIQGLINNSARLWAMNAVQSRFAGRSFAGFDVNPFDLFQKLSEAHDNPEIALDFWRRAHDRMANGMNKYLDDRMNATVGQPKEYRNLIEGEHADLKSFMDSVNDMKSQIDQGTYVPLSHGDGKYFVSAKLKMDGNFVDAKTAKAVNELLEKHGYELGVSADTSNPTFMTRLHSEAATDRLAKIFGELQKDGHIEGGSISRGNVERVDNVPGRVTPEYVQSILNNMGDIIGKSGVTKEQYAQIMKNLTHQWLDLLPSGAMDANAVRRSFAAGASKDMLNAGKASVANQMRAAASIGISDRMSAAMAGMRQEIDQIKRDPNLSTSQIISKQDYVEEILKREAARKASMGRTWVDGLTAAAHAIHVGFHPAYVLVAQSQIPMLLHPELAKKFGQARSAMAIGSVTKQAWDVLLGSLKTEGEGHTVSFRKDMLDGLVAKGKLSQRQADMLIRLDNAGGLSSSTYTSMMSHTEHGGDSLYGKYSRWANTMGLAAETMPRLVAALAADKLYGSLPEGAALRKQLGRDAYIKDVVQRSQFNYAPGESPRFTSSAGPLGPGSRIAFGFMQFQLRMLHKLGEETRGLIGGDAKTRAESTQWLAGHFLATTALAGTLGLPFAASAAGALDKLLNTWFNRDDVDTVGMYRTYLSSVFGPDVADVIAKGIPRSFGMDLSKLGDQNLLHKLLPGSQILIDKRKFEDAYKDWLKDMAGVAPADVANLALGGRDLLNGDYMQALIKAAPEGLKGLAEAGNIYEHGYIDKDGRKYPMQPGARDILMTALGIDPASFAQYNEARKIQSGLEAQRQYREQNISRHLSYAMNTGDPEKFRYWMNQSMQYAQQHPMMGMGPIGGLGRMMQQSLMEPAMARTLGTPLGVKPFDFGMRHAVGFVNPGQNQ